MLSTWISEQERSPSPYAKFGVLDSEEIDEPSDETMAHLTGLLRSAHFEPGYLSYISERIGWSKTKDLILAPRAATPTKVKRGDFGEALFGAVLEELHDYQIPVPKLRYKVTASQTLTGTDTLAIRVSQEGRIREVCFVETKLRTARDAMVAVEGCKQLADDYAERLPGILQFVSQRLYERRHSLLEPFVEYMRSREDLTGMDSFRLAVFWDHGLWREAVLENLEVSEVKVSPLSVHAVRIRELRTLIDNAYETLGVTEIEDDD